MPCSVNRSVVNWLKWLEGSDGKALESAGGEARLLNGEVYCVYGGVPSSLPERRSLMYRQWGWVGGGDLINIISVLPEAKELRCVFPSFFSPKSHRSSC